MIPHLLRTAVLWMLMAVPLTLCTGQSTVRSIQIDRDRGWLGVVVEDVTTRLKERKKLTVDAGAYVKEVVEDSPAEKAGIEEGDVIVMVDGKTIDDSDDLTKAVRRLEPKSEVKIQVLHKRERKTVTARLERARDAYAYHFGFDEPVIPEPFPPGRVKRFRMMSGGEFGGLQVQDLTKQLGEYFEVPGRRGILVVKVEERSRAGKAGFKAGDVIVKANRSAVRDIDDLREEIRDAEGKEIPLEVIRKGKTMTLSLTLGRGKDEVGHEPSLRCIPHDGNCDGYRCPAFIQPEVGNDLIERLNRYIRTLKSRLEERWLDLRQSVELNLRSA